MHRSQSIRWNLPLVLMVLTGSEFRLSSFISQLLAKAILVRWTIRSETTFVLPTLIRLSTLNSAVWCCNRGLTLWMLIEIRWSGPLYLRWRRDWAKATAGPSKWANMINQWDTASINTKPFWHFHRFNMIVGYVPETEVADIHMKSSLKKLAHTKRMRQMKMITSV